MKKFFKYFLIFIFIVLFIAAIGYVIKSNAGAKDNSPTESPIVTDIVQKAVATGKIKPKETIEIKPNISGIIKEIHVKEGDYVEVGQLLVTIRVVPNVSSVNSAQQAINSANINLENQKRQFNRQKLLYSQGVISKQEYENSETSYKNSKQDLNLAQRNYEIAKTGVAKGLESLANIQIRSTTKGMILDIPVEVGNQVIEANTFNAGTTIASIADVNKMIFEGKVDEADAGKLHEGMKISILIGALQNEKLEGTLTFISPQGVEENGAVKYEIKGDILTKINTFIRAGYSANAEIELSRRKNVLTIREALVQYENDKPYVEILQPDKKFKKVFLTLGASDGLNVEVLKGIKKSDKIKVWNPTDEDKDKK